MAAQSPSASSRADCRHKLAAVLLAVCALFSPSQGAHGAEPTLRLLGSLGSESDPRVQQLWVLSWSPTGRFLAGWSGIRGTILLYDVELDRLEEYRASAGQVRTIAWGGNGETLAALVRRAANAWDLMVWSTANGQAVATHALHEENLPDQCRFVASRPRAYPWLLLSRDGHSFWVGCSGSDGPSTYPAAARFDLRTQAWSTIELASAHPDLKESLHPQFFQNHGRDLLFLVRRAGYGSKQSEKQSEIWLTVVDVGSGEARNVPLGIASPRQSVFRTLPHLNGADVTVAFSSVREGRPLPTPSNEVEADYEHRIGTINLDRKEFTPPLVFDRVSGSGQGLSLLPNRRAVLLASASDTGVYSLNLDSGSRMKLLPVTDAVAMVVDRNGRRMAVKRQRVHNKSFVAEIDVYSIE